jgi:hypothetical protein
MDGVPAINDHSGSLHEDVNADNIHRRLQAQFIDDA